MICDVFTIQMQVIHFYLAVKCNTIGTVAVVACGRTDTVPQINSQGVTGFCRPVIAYSVPLKNIESHDYGYIHVPFRARHLTREGFLPKYTSFPFETDSIDVLQLQLELQRQHKYDFPQTGHR